MHVLLFIVAVIAAVAAEDVSFFTDCGSNNVKALRIQGCTTNPCQLKRGTKAAVEFDFKPSVDSDQIRTSVAGIIVDPLEIQWTGADPNGCNSIQGGCPVKSSDTYTYKSELEVKAIYPKIKVTVVWRLKTADNAILSCFKVPVELV